MRTGDTNKCAHHQTTSNLSLFRVSVGDSPQTPTRPTSPMFDWDRFANRHNQSTFNHLQEIGRRFSCGICRAFIKGVKNQGTMPMSGSLKLGSGISVPAGDAPLHAHYPERTDT